MTNTIVESWYAEMIDECKSILTEGVLAHRWELLKTYHEIGVRIKQEHGEFERSKIYGERLCEAIAKSLTIKPTKDSPGMAIKPRLIYQCLQFVEKFPDLNAIPDGKNCSWNKMVHKYLPAHKDAKEKPDLKDRIKQFIADYFPALKKSQKELLMDGIKMWESYK